jgi:hypothetical protein
MYTSIKKMSREPPGTPASLSLTSVCPQSRLLCGQTVHFLAKEPSVPRLRKCEFQGSLSIMFLHYRQTPTIPNPEKRPDTFIGGPAAGKKLNAPPPNSTPSRSVYPQYATRAGAKKCRRREKYGAPPPKSTPSRSVYPQYATRAGAKKCRRRGKI